MTENKVWALNKNNLTLQQSIKVVQKSTTILKAFENYRKQFLIYRVMKFLKLR